MYPREAGSLPNDVTAFHKAQQDWGFERHQRPEILHQYEKAGYQNLAYPVPIWVYNGKVVLDYEDHPILAFRNMPATISTKVEGGLQEAISREDSRIDVKDFRARMMENPKGKGKQKSTRPTLSAISMRRSRFRWRAGYLSWTTRTGSQDIKAYLDGLLPEACKLSNSTKGFRDLKRSEVKLMSEKNRGKHLKRAGTRSITVEKRMQVDAAFYRSIEEAKAYEDNLEAEQERLLKEESYETEDLEDDDSECEDLQEYNPDDDPDFDEQFDALVPFVRREFDDHRFATPTSEQEMHIVYLSLQPTRIQFHQLTGHAPPHHRAESSYARQWVYLFRYFTEVWEKLGYPEPPPSLIQTTKLAWENGFPEIEISTW